MQTLETLCRFSVQKNIDIAQYLLELFENFVYRGPGFFQPQCKLIVILGLVEVVRP